VTATRTAGTGDQWFYADAFEVTGQHSSPIGATGHIAGNGLSSPQSVTLSGAPASTSAIFGQIGTDNGPSPMFTPPSGWTEANEIAAAGGWGSVAETAFINTGGSTTFSWTSTSGAQFALVALEILVAAGVTDPYPAGYNPHIQQNTVYRL
jgi:hypothetical protein